LMRRGSLIAMADNARRERSTSSTKSFRRMRPPRTTVHHVRLAAEPGRAVVSDVASLTSIREVSRRRIPSLELACHVEDKRLPIPLRRQVRDVDAGWIASPSISSHQSSDAPPMCVGAGGHPQRVGLSHYRRPHIGDVRGGTSLSIRRSNFVDLELGVAARTKTA